MAVYNEKPYGNFNFLVSIGGEQGDGGEGEIVGGFSEMSGGLGFTINYAKYRNGNERFNTERKVPLMHSNDDVTLKRGLVGSLDLFNWVKGVRDGVADPRTVVITLLNQARQPVATFKLRNAQPSVWKGPPLSATGTAVAVEELHFVHEGVE